MAPIFRQTKPNKPNNYRESSNGSSTNMNPQQQPPVKSFTSPGGSGASPAFGQSKPEPARSQFAPPQQGSRTTLVGHGLTFKGEIEGHGSVRIEGKFIGKLNTSEEVIIGEGGRVEGDVNSRIVTVIGELVGNVKAEDKINIEVKGSMIGDIVAPRVVVAEGAIYKGRIDMEPKDAKQTGKSKDQDAGKHAKPQENLKQDKHGDPTPPPENKTPGGPPPKPADAK